MGSAILQPSMVMVEIDSIDRNQWHSSAFGVSQLRSPAGLAADSGVYSSLVLQRPSHHIKRHKWRRAFALDTGGSSNAGGQDSLNGENTGVGTTRLGMIVRAAARQLLDKLNAARKNLPMKVFLLLLGFYTANALATILGQTGDWDVLVAGVVVAAIEGIGMLMYRKPLRVPTGRLQSLLVMVNYWKAGVCLGLFVDAFKLGS